MKNDTLKEYYVKLEGLWNNVTNILLAINQSFHTNSSEISVQIADSDDSSSIIRIPSFLYLENKLETLSNNFSNLFNMPNSGEAWFNSSDNSNMYKLEMVKSGVAPVTPVFDKTNLVTSITDNTFLKDLVSPRTFLRLNINNMPDNINKIFMKKYVIYDYNLFNSLKNANITSYNDYLTYIYGLHKGIDYDEYDSVLDTPIKSDKYNAKFKIVNLPDPENNPWIDSTNNSSKYSYKIELDTFKYIHKEDSSIEFSLKIGDKICLNNEFAIYKIKEVNNSNKTIIIEEEAGHIKLQTYEENSEMVFTLYNNDYSDYHYVDIPLEENPYICVFIGTIHNNVRSLLSEPLLINLNETYITDKNGQYMYDINGNKLNYIDYYKQECINIGDLILGLTQSAYPQLTLLDTFKLQQLQTSSELINYINNSINTSLLQVVPINKHTIDNIKTEEIVSLHAQKNELNSQLIAVNNSISTVNNKLISTDFSQEVAVTYQSLSAQLNEYYSERLLLQKQMITLVENINGNLASVTGKNIKYRIRGVCDTSAIENYLHNSIDKKLDIIGIDVEYKYKSINKETTSITSINSNIFSDWNKLVTIDKQRIIKFDTDLNTYKLEFENYDSTTNIIKWNQIDIPIVSDEDVIIRVRYKYNIGQPFVNIYSPWSEELTIIFPVEYKENVDISSIQNENANDIINAKFNNTLINDGYQQHINNSLIVADGTFYHMPENIYSGFNTAENKMISLKDKLNSISKDIDNYSKMISEAINQKYGIYITIDDKTIKLFDSTTNKINIVNNDNITDAFIKKNINIVIRNEGDIPIKLYSIFPGNINTPLLLCNDEFYEKTIVNYERVPIIINNEITGQRLGQFIYFRQNNFWTGEDIYKVSNTQNNDDFDKTITNSPLEYLIKNNNILGYYPIYEEKNNQPLLGYRKRSTGHDTIYENRWHGIIYDNKTKTLDIKSINSTIETVNLVDYYKNLSLDHFIYKNDQNRYILRYEDIYYETDNGERIFLDNTTSIQEFLNNAKKSKGGFTNIFNKKDSFIGCFLYPDIPSETNILTSGGIHDYIELSVGKSISIPLTLEYFIDISANLFTDIDLIFKKSIYFDLKTSLYKDVEHFMFEINIHNKSYNSSSIINNVSLYDDTTNTL